MKKKNKIYILVVVLGIVLLSGCIGSNEQITPVPTETTPETTPVATIPTETETPVSTTEGITYEEQIRNNPPAPRNLVGEFKANYIELKWDAPEKVTIPHNYSDVIIRYNIYKGTTEEDMRYLTSTPKLEFKDFNVTTDSQYTYEITAVHEGDTEGSPTQDIVIDT